MNAAPATLELAASDVLDSARRKSWQIVTAESCTGGMIGQYLTSQAGSSDVYSGGFITYSNEMKMAALGVPKAILKTHGAVSRETAEAMARGALATAPISGPALALSVTGIAGPGGGSAEKPVGLVWIGWATSDGGCQAEEFRFGAELSRELIRNMTVAAVFAIAGRLLDDTVGRSDE